LNDLGRREQLLRIYPNELASEGAEIHAESVSQPRAVVLVLLRQSGEILLDVTIDSFPAELELRELLLQQIPEARTSAGAAAAEDFQRLPLGLDGEEDSLLHLAAARFSLTVNNG